jgi:hypothetical protein
VVDPVLSGIFGERESSETVSGDELPVQAYENVQTDLCKEGMSNRPGNMITGYFITCLGKAIIFQEFLHGSVRKLYDRGISNIDNCKKI